MRKDTTVLDESNVDEAISRAIDVYWDKGLIADALFWSKIIAILRDKLKTESEKKG